MKNQSTTGGDCDPEKQYLRERVAEQEQLILQLRQQLAQVQYISQKEKQAGDSLCQDHQTVLASQTAQIPQQEQIQLFYQLLIEMLPDAVILLDSDHTIFFCNQQAAHMHGYTTPEHIIGKTITEFIAPQDRAAAYENAQRMQEHGAIERFERMLLRRDGMVFPAEISTSILSRAADHQPTAYLSIARDISSRKQADAERIASENRFQRLVEHAPVAIVIRQDTTILYINQKGIELTGYTLAELGQLSPEEFFHPDTIAEALNRVKQYQQGMPRQSSSIIKIITKDQRILWLDVSSTSIDFYGKPALLSIGIDVTKQKHTEATLIEHESLLARRRLTDIVMHEIRTPMQNMQALLDIFHLDSEEQRQKTFSTLQNEVDRIIGILSQLQEVYPTHPDQQDLVDMNQLIERILQLTKGTLKKAGIACRQTLEATNPYVAGQSDALTQVLLNLIFNAIDAMVPGGTIHITTRNHQDTVLIDIIDRGTGIAPDVMPYLFEPFFTTKKTGTGLGLFICHEIVTKHHGMIDIASPPGRGTVVTITFPSGEVIPGAYEEGI